MLRLHQVKVEADKGQAGLEKRAAEFLRIPLKEILSIRIVRQSIDARKKPEVFLTYTLDVEVRDQESVLRRFRGKENLVSRAENVRYAFPAPGKRSQEHPTVIIGMGPAGLFCGYFLALYGYKPLILERGRAVEERQADVERFWETGKLDTASNVQFGEGGAGAFSDGKLNTLVKDKDGRNGIVLETLVKFGAKKSICYEAKPHIGTDVLCQVVRRMRQEIIRLGGTVRFSSCVTELLTEGGRVTGVVVNGREKLSCEQVVLACGHSARDTFFMLEEKKIPMEAKAFAVGLRVEHPQSMINLSQYGKEEPGVLGAASYKVTAKASNGRGVYSFCMCPGGYVVNASSEEGRTAVNGMSYSGRNGKNANSAVIVSVTPEDFGSNHPLAGIEFQRRLEEKAYELGGGKIPVQRYGDFRSCVEREKEKGSLSAGGQFTDHEVISVSMAEEKTVPDGLTGMESVTGILAENDAVSGSLTGMESISGNRAEDEIVFGGLTGKESISGIMAEDKIASGSMTKDKESAGANVPAQRGVDGVEALQPQCKGGFDWADVSRILPQACNEAIVEGMTVFGRQIKGFDRPEVLLSGVESRTSSPVRICRDESLQSVVRGLYPCGEGAGYAGGITSAAMDGLRVAEVIAAVFAPSGDCE